MLTIALVIIAVLSCVGVLHSWFTDNLIQRVGLSMTCVGSVLTAASMHNHCPQNAATILLCGVALYAIGTAKNAIMFHHIQRPHHAPERKLHPR